MPLLAHRSYSWTADHGFLLRQLVSKDFKIRYRNMSLGIFWSLLNPLVFMAVYTFVFTVIFKSSIPHFPLHILCGLIIFNFFSASWLTSTTSLVDNAHLIKRIPIRREIIPIAAILGNLVQLLIQLGLLVVFVVGSGVRPNVEWLWLPVLLGLELVFLIGLGLASSALNMFFRDVRYVVESVTVVLFWLIPAVYSIDMVPLSNRGLYLLNPLAALVFAIQNIVIYASAPSLDLLAKLAGTSAAMLLLGTIIFRSSDARFYEYF